MDSKLKDLETRLRARQGGEVRFDHASKTLYSTDASIFLVEPAGVVLPRTPDDLTAAVNIAMECEVPIVPRGGGTSLSGQSIGSGLVIDCSKYLRGIGPLEPGQTTVTVQPGVVLDQLNRHVGQFGLQFGPEVATSSRATLGGMIGNNSAGARSIVFGRTLDHVRSLTMVHANGERVKWTRDDSASSYNAPVASILQANHKSIEAAFPKILRRVSGYNLIDCLDGRKGLVPLLVGSEGTLGFLLEAELDLIPKPKERGLVVPSFSSLRASLDALHMCLEAKPSAVELLDRLLIDLAKKQPAIREGMRAIQGVPEALLMIEIVGEDAGEVKSRCAALAEKLRRAAGVTDVIEVHAASEREPLWNARRSAVPLLYGMKGKRKPITFVEDTAVAPEILPDFADAFKAILKAHDTDGTFYGHASVGCLHIRPLIDPHEATEVAKMRAIMEDVTTLVRNFGGSLSGEHGDGLVRSEWNRKMFGEEVYEAFRQVKRIFDPKNLFNPGKIVDAPAMTDNLRYPKAERIALIQTDTVYDYAKQEGFFNSIELCNGSGVCRKTQGGAMCPSYRATLDENDTPRGRANALREVLLSDSKQPIAERWVKDVMDLCLGCKACKTECPSNVDVAKLKSEFLHAYHKEHSRPRSHKLARDVDWLNAKGYRFSRLANFLGSFGPARWLMEKTHGIDRRRSLPRFASHRFADSWGFDPWNDTWTERFERNQKGGKSIVVFGDCLTSYTEPGIGAATVEILESLGFMVLNSAVRCCGRAKISKGYLDEAKQLVRENAPVLRKEIESAEAIIGWEPSCVTAIQDEWTELLPGADTAEIARKTHLIGPWLAARSDELKPLLKPAEGAVLCHTHCQQRATMGTGGVEKLLGPDAKMLDAGCCGMAGSFGYEKEHFDISKRIAELGILPELAKAPNATVIADGTSCRHQIKDFAGREAKHLVEWLAERLK